MRGDAYINVSCDAEGCQTYEAIELTSLARGGWDERNVSGALKRMGWSTKDDLDLCPDHSEEGERDDR